jgi:transcriptional regulator with XRE-family HTH domain
MAISPAQCRSARTLLAWSVAKLAAAAGVAESTINDLETERRMPDGAVLGPVQRAFEEVGVVFLPQDDVRLGSGVA